MKFFALAILTTPTISCNIRLSFINEKIVSWEFSNLASHFVTPGEINILILRSFLLVTNDYVLVVYCEHQIILLTRQGSQHIFK